MAKFINFNTPREEQPALGATFYLWHTTEDGAKLKIELTGDEIVSTACPICGKEHAMDFNDFLDVMQDGELYGTTVYCSECTARRRRGI